MALTRPLRLVASLFCLFVVGQGLSASPVWSSEQTCSGGDAEGCFTAGNDAYHAKDLNSARRFYTLACEAGHPVACQNMAVFYGKGEGVQQDEQRAGGYSLRACEGGWAKSCAIVANLHLQGRAGFEKNAGKAATFYEKACELNDPKSCFDIAYLLYYGDGVEQDRAKSAALYRQACNWQFSKACYNLGTAYRDGYGVAKDLAEAASLFKRACEAGNTGGCAELGMAHLLGEGVTVDQKVGTDLIAYACDDDHPLACTNLGLFHRDGKHALPVDFPRSVQLFERACTGGYASGCFFLGEAYLQGLGVAEDKSAMARFFAKACEGGELRGCVNLGTAHIDGDGVAKDVNKAVTLYQKACDGGELHGCSELGLSYASGESVEQDLCKAGSLFKQACDGGIARACGFLDELTTDDSRQTAEALTSGC